MSPTEIRAVADKLDAVFDMPTHIALLRACADVVEAAKHEHGKRGGDGGESECPLCVAVDRVEALQP